MKMTHRHGLTELYSPREEAVVHIVFVHGLFGHPFKTWSARSKSTPPLNSITTPQNVQNELEPWPKTLLSSVIPDAGIFTWGYDADVNRFLSSAGQNSIHQHAGNLLSDLADTRVSPQDQAIPIIFVVHSLGGIIVKDALNQSSSTEGTRLKSIAPATFGVLFLGTPNRGSTSASLGKIAYRATLVATMRPNLKLLKGLEKKSETLDTVGDRFSQTLLRHDIRLYSFREEQFTRKFVFFKIMVVDADSAKVGDGKEEVGSIPANHSNMTKFHSLQDIGFRRVSSQLRRWVDEINAVGVNEDSDDCVKSLDTAETRTRISEVHKAHEKTFNWLFDPAVVTFADWLCGQGTMAKKPIYWVQGKPGSGKSTLMKFAMRNNRTTELLANCSTDKWIFAAFFFHDRGSNVQKSLTGMMKEILYSILSQLPALVAFVIPLYRDLVQSQQTNRPQWELSVLKAALFAIMQQRQVRMQLCLFLDALDEHNQHDGNNERLAEFLKELVEKATDGNIRLKMCLASRSWTVFQQHFSDCPGFAIHKHTAEDIYTYTKSRISLNQRGLQPFLSETQLENISRQTTDKSLGVFIWVRLVVDQLTKAVRDGTTFLALEDLVMKLPGELEELYAHTLRRIDSDYCEEACIMLRTILCSLEPLSLYTLMRITNHNIYQIKETTKENTSIDSLEIQLLRLESRCGGLLEVVPKTKEALDLERYAATSIPHESENYLVQFIHQTVKEYVHEHRNRLELKDINLLMQGQSGYVYHLNWANTDMASTTRANLLTYARLYEETLDPSNEKEVKSAFQLLTRTARASYTNGSIGNWFDDFSQYYRKVTRLSETEPILSFIFAVAANLNFYVRSLGPITTAEVEKAPFLLHMAAMGRNRAQVNLENSRMIKNLLSLGYPVDQDCNFPQLKICDPFLGIYLMSMVTPLAYVLMVENRFIRSEAKLTIARTLLEAGADPNGNAVIGVYSGNNVTSSPFSFLEFSIRYESASFVRLLLQYGAKISGEIMVGNLEYAHTRRNQEVIQALKDHGLVVNSISNDMAAGTICGALSLANPTITAPSGISVHIPDSLVHPMLKVRDA